MRPLGRRSLRARLFVLIVLPLIVVAALSSAARFHTARDMSQQLYDDTLRVVAHTVAREVVLTRGDLVTDALLESLVTALGDPIFYQVRADEGYFIVGHSDAPEPANTAEVPGGVPFFFDAVYHGMPVRVVMLREFIADPEFDGWTSVTVWQTVTQRQALRLNLVGQAMLNGLLLVLAAAGLVWFGINRGLAPLTDLRAAVARRSETDLGPIRRGVPREVAPLVSTINSLFARLSAELDRRKAFISDAAHQLRNPVAAIQAQAEAAQAAKGSADMAARLDDLTIAARRLSRMSQQLLRLDAAQHSAQTGDAVDLSALAAEVARRRVPAALAAGVDLELDAPEAPLPVRINPVMIEEAIDNLIDNALKYGAAPGTRLAISLRRDTDMAVLTVADEGRGIAPQDAERVFERFFRLAPDDDSTGCGLGLPIVRTIAQSAGGDARILPSAKGCHIALSLPLSEAA
ncbi:MAG: sensor histidine kinase [Paracoccus sp. (in: a-proteobacteria)]|nr:sensor histidine kinase [Paracoccus sp. (in: a-proteobacteria)]